MSKNDAITELKLLEWAIYKELYPRFTRLLLGAVLFFSVLFFISGFIAGRELFPRKSACEERR